MRRAKSNRIVGDKRYTVSNEFKQECKRNVNQYGKTGRLHIVGTDTDITESDNLVNFTIEDNCYANDKFIGTTIAKKVTVDILNPNNSIDLENKEIQVYTGIVIDSENEEVPFGTFIISKPDNEEVKEKTNFVGYDYMIKFDTPYKDQVTYPCQAKVLFQDLCNQVGIVGGNIDFVNCNYMILGNPFTNNEICREVLSNLAQLAGGFAKIGRDNKVYIVSLDKSTIVETINGNNYFTDFAKNKQWGELNSLTLRISGIEGENITLQDNTSIIQNGLTELVLEDNYFLINQEEREKVATPIWNNLKGLKYLPFKTDYYGYPYLDSGDKIKILDSKDNECESYVFNHTFTFNGSYGGKLETTALTRVQTNYKNTDNTRIKFRKVERKIDKINGIIEDVIEEQTDYEHKLTKVEQDINNINQKVENTIDYKREVEGVTEIHITDAGKANILKLEVKGNKTYEANLFPRDNLYPGESLYPNQEVL